METKTFFIISLLVVGIVAGVTSLIGVSVFQKPVLLQPFGTAQQGKVDIAGGIGPGIIDVIIIDDLVIAGISDIVSFTGITKGSTVNTDLDDSTPDPYPFVLRNDGDETADVDVYATADLFTFQYNVGGSALQFKILEPTPFDLIDADIPYQDNIDDCLAVTLDPVFNCYLSATEIFTNVPTGAGSAVQAINDFYPFDEHDNAIMDIQITVDALEPSGTKQTTVVIVGVPA